MSAKRERYTPNDVGPSPREWAAPKLSEVSTLITNGFVGTATPFYTDSSGVPYLYGTNVRANKLEASEVRYITREFHEAQSKTALKNGDLLTVQSGHIGETAVVTEQFEGANCHALIVTRLKQSSVFPEYLSYYINSEIGRARMRGLEVGSTILHINTKDLKKFRVLLPSLPEQKKIAQILSTWDKAITTTEQLLANSQKQKKALMQQLLTGKKRLLDENGVRFGREWHEVSLSAICEINPKKSPSPEDGKVSFVAMEAVSEDAKLISSVIRDYDDVSKGFTSFSDSDVLVAKITPCFENGKGAYIEGMQNCMGFGSTEFHVLRAGAKSDSKYLYYITNTSEFRVRGEANMQGSAGQKRVTTDYLKSLKVTVPTDVVEQQKIAAVLSTADQDITVLQQKLDVLRQEKKALMQQLLTGKRRVLV